MQDVKRSSVRHQLRKRAVDIRKRRTQIVAALYITLAAIITFFAFNSPFFYIRYIRVIGLHDITSSEAKQIVALMQIPSGINLFLAPASRLTGEINHFPFVSSVNISRRFPDRLEVTVTPRLPGATLSTANGSYEVDAGGMVIRSSRGKTPLIIHDARSTAVKTGSLINEPTLIASLLILNQCTVLNPDQLTKIEVDQNADICLNMKDSLVIRFGQSEDLSAKMVLLRHIFVADPGIAGEVESIDLRCPEAPSCTPRVAVGNAPERVPLSGVPSRDSRDSVHQNDQTTAHRTMDTYSQD